MPPVSPSNIKLEKIGTGVNVSWNLMTPEEAWGFVISYTVSYSKDGSSSKRQSVETTVPATQNSMIIEDADPDYEYVVIVWASTVAGMGKQSKMISTRGIIILLWAS